MHAKLCLKQDGKSTFNYENDIARMASVLKKKKLFFQAGLEKTISSLFIDASHLMSFSLSSFTVRPASFAEHASI